MRIAIPAVLSLALATPATAQMPCGERAKIIEHLEKRYGESLAHFGVAGKNNLMEVFTSATGSWTVIMTTPERVTCVMAAGQGWSDGPPKPIKGDPA